jgi:hypothetical protein
VWVVSNDGEQSDGLAFDLRHAGMVVLPLQLSMQAGQHTPALLAQRR